MSRPNRDTRKSKEAFRTISEAADELDVPQHVLRFWETKFSQIRPMKRAGNRRYYRPEDVELLRVIRHNLYNDGYTIKGVQKLLREGAVKGVPPKASAPQPAPATPPPAAAAAPNTATTTATPGLDGGRRKALEEVLGELETLRDLLKSDD